MEEPIVDETRTIKQALLMAGRGSQMIGL